MTPVEVHPSAARKMSTEDNRLTQLMTSKLEDVSAKQDSSTTYVLESRVSDPNISASEDSSPDSKPAALPECVAATDNTNSNNNSNNGGVYVTTTSLYIDGSYQHTRSSDNVEPEINRRSNEAETTYISTNSDISISNSEPTPCQPQDPTF